VDYPNGFTLSEDLKVNAPGAYLLHLEVCRTLRASVGALGKVRLAAGRYIYVGSARRGIAARVSRHRRLAENKEGKLHWHIDYLLVHPHTRLVSVSSLPGADECAWSERIARRKGTSIAVPRFGASDCRSGCLTHLYRIA
jgi:Uri superfamily endonuclease